MALQPDKDPKGVDPISGETQRGEPLSAGNAGWSRKRFSVTAMVLRVVSAYVIVSAAWILVSDRVLESIVADPHLRITLSMVKGWAFVAVTALLLYLLLRREGRRWNRERAGRTEAEVALRLQNEQQQLLLEASRLAWEAAGSEEELANSLMQVISPRLDAECCLHYRLVRPDRHLSLINAIGVTDEVAEKVKKVDLDQGAVGVAATTGTPVSLDAEQIATANQGTFARLFAVRAYLVFPLLARSGEVLGTLSFGTKKRDRFTDAEFSVLQAVARVASLATERMRATSAMRSSERRFRHMADSLPQLVWTCDAAGVCDFLSVQWEEFTGIPVQQQLGTGWLNQAHPDDRDRLLQAWQTAVRTGTAAQAEYRIRAKNGSYHWFDARGIPQRDETGRILMWFGSNTDITEQKEAELALRESEERLRLFIEHAPAALAMFDRSMRYLAVSRRWNNDYHLGDRQILGLSHYEIFPEIPTRWKDIHRRALSGEVVRSELDSFSRADGRTQWLRWEVRPWNDAAGNVGGIVVFSEDISARVVAEEALRHSEAKFSTLFNKASLPVALTRFPDHVFVDVNDAWTRVFGFTKEETIGKNSFELGLNRNVIQRKNTHEQLRDHRLIHDREQLLYAKDGEERTVLTSIDVVKIGSEEFALCSLQDITERKRGELALRESEERFRAVVESAGDAIFIQTNGCFAYLNPAAVQLFGARDNKALVGKPVLERFHPDDRAKVRERIQKLNTKREVVPLLEERVLLEDGMVIYAEFSAVPFVHRGEQGALVFARNVTERRRNEERLHFQQAILEETGQIAKVGGWSFDAVTGEGFWTDEVARIHDLSPEESTELKTGLKYYQGESRRQIEEAIKRAVEHGEAYDLELELVTATGRRKWVRTIGHPVLEGGKVIRVRGSFQDITERKKSEEALRESEARFRQVVENIEEVFWVTDPEKNSILYISPAYENVWGRSVASVVEAPKSWIEAIHEDDRERVLQSAMKRQAAGTYAETYRIRRPDGSLRWIEDRAFPVRDASGRVYRIVGTAKDVTEHRKLEAQYRQAQKMEAIGTLAGGIAHDFNNILGAISGFAELAKMDPIPATIDTSLDEILKACKRASDLVRQILAFSRQQEQKRQPLQLWRVVDEAIRLLRAALPSTIEFDIELTDRVPSVLADSTQIHQIVMNLCTNAAHAMAGKAGKLTVKLDDFEADEAFATAHPGAHAGRYVRLEIRDTGHGMSPATLERIFEPFFTTKAPGEGSGLGLAVVHGIIQNHDGIITVYSRPGAGSTFHVYLPAFQQDGAEPEARQPEIIKGRGEAVLVLDDELPLARMTGKMLTALGYRVTVETKPVEVLAELQKSEVMPFDLILADLTMPQMTGLEFAAEVLRLKPATRFVFMTGYLTRQNQTESNSMNIKEILLKPVTMRTLAETIHRVLNS